MTTIPKIPVDLYNYTLPEDRIAHFPASPRDHSKLLLFQNNKISDYHFYDLPELIPANTTFVANNTKVIPARLYFLNDKGRKIQIFILKPIAIDWSVCEVLVGNRKKFKVQEVLILRSDDVFLKVSWNNRDLNLIQFETNAASILDAVQVLGQVPLPPYILRDVESSDKDSYQAIFAEKEGAVAAPTASLHFTDELKANLEKVNIKFDEVTLHVSAGTFKPVTAEFANEHEMHAERFEVSAEFLNRLLDCKSGIVAIGTTSTRVLESLYFLGEKAHLGILDDCFVASTDAYDNKFGNISTRDALICLRDFALNNGGFIKGETQIFIVPGFEFRIVQCMITNFHQPKSTLLMLISAFIGEAWKEVYAHAMANDYRFLSYGDGSLLHGIKNISF
jgi:S-adenosylmethionine:tRNA ribosyltransferase-isomerase